MTILKETAKFVGWLSTALAGIGAILYGLGYLVVLSQNHVLGLGPLFQYNHHYYLQRGLRFFLDILTFPHDLVFAGLVFAVLISGILVVPWAVSAKLLQSRQAASLRLSNWMERWRQCFPKPFRAPVFYALLLALSVFYSYDGLILCEEPLGVTDLLFGDTATTPTGLEASIVTHDQAVLEDRFERILFAAFVSMMLLALARHVTTGWRWRNLAVAPFALVALIYLILLPMDYGVLMLKAEYHRVRLTTEKGLSTRLKDPLLFLLTGTDRAFVVWNTDVREVFWIPLAEVRQLDLLPKRPIPLAPSRSPQNPRPAP